MLAFFYPNPHQPRFKEKPRLPKRTGLELDRVRPLELESQLSRMNCQTFSTGLSSGHFGGSRMMVILAGTRRRVDKCQPAYRADSPRERRQRCPEYADARRLRPPRPIKAAHPNAILLRDYGLGSFFRAALSIEINYVFSMMHQSCGRG